MTTTRFAAFSFAFLLAPCCLLATGNSASAGGDCHHCPKTVFCRPKPPCIKYKCVCPKPICPCCEIENYGYYPTCWHPWPFPPNYSHCPCPPTIMTAPCCINGAPKMDDQLPAPNPVRGPALQ
jgi:hypothetical protein